MSTKPGEVQVGNLHTAYVEANHRIRRQINQAIFARLLISSDGDVIAELRPPFNLLLQASGTGVCPDFG